MTIKTAWRLVTAVTPLLLTAFLLAGAPARAEWIQGHFTYQDIDAVRPINDSRVEIWRSGPDMGWTMAQRVWTDSTGWINVEIPWAGPGVTYAVRVYASNAHVNVFPNYPSPLDVWYEELPHQTVANSTDVLDFTHNFDEPVAAGNFNIARTVWFAGEYMAQTYGNLPQARALIGTVISTFYDPANDLLWIGPLSAFDDFAIAHEYGHFVAEQIGSLPWLPAEHDLCVATKKPALAWMEGFADYYSQAVARKFPGEIQGNEFYLESNSACGERPNDTTEYFVAAALWDLIDDGTPPYSFSESFDSVSNQEAVILSIVDNELGAFGSQPTVWDFRTAWINQLPSQERQLDVDRIFANDGLLPDFNFASPSYPLGPPQMTTGHTYPVQVTMRNTGSKTWSAAGGYALGSQDPQDNTTWGFHRVSLPHDVKSGQYVTFNFYVTAPAQLGNFPFRWKMVQENVEWFGDTTPPYTVSVTGLQNAQFISQSVPASMRISNTYSASVTMKNVGDTTWIPGTYFLGSQNPQDNSTWGLNRVPLPYAVGPGGQVTFTFDVTTPYTGSYNFQWRMIQSGVDWFGDTTPNLTIGVSAPPPTCDSSQCAQSCIDAGCHGGSCTSAGRCNCLHC